jgi:hypothetical protein
MHISTSDIRYQISGSHRPGSQHQQATGGCGQAAIQSIASKKSQNRSNAPRHRDIVAIVIVILDDCLMMR